jgi:DNA-binding transcriptional LysR family regulator
MSERPSRLNHLRFRHLQLVDALMRHGSVHKAARALHLSQPAASTMLRDLEQTFGSQLFRRSRQGVTPTAEAHVLTERARAIAHELDNAVADVAAVSQGAAVRLAIGAMPRVMLDFMPRLMSRVRREWPRARFCLEEGVPAHLLPRLEDGRLDCLISRLPFGAVASERAGALMLAPLYHDGMCLACGPSHPLARLRRVRLERLAEADWILPPTDTEARRIFVDTFLQAGVTPPLPAIESLSAVANMAIVTHSPLLTVAPLSAARERQKLGLLKILPVRVDSSVAPVSFIWRRARRESAAIARLRTLAEQCARERPVA